MLLAWTKRGYQRTRGLYGNNLIAKPNEPIQYKEEMKMVIGQLTQLRNFCNGNNVKLIIWLVINRISSWKEPFDTIRALNNHLAENKLYLHFRTFSYEEDFLPDNVHMKYWWYVNAGFDLVNMCSCAPEARPDLVDITLPNFNWSCFQCVQFKIQISQFFPP